MPHHWEQPYYDRIDAVYAGERLPRRLRLSVSSDDRTLFEELEEPEKFARIAELLRRMGDRVREIHSYSMAEAVKNLLTESLSVRRPS